MGAIDAVDSEHDGIRRLLTATSGTAAIQACWYGLSLLTVLLLARLLGTAGYGVYALASSWTTLLGFPAILGFDRFVVRGLAVYVDRKQWALARGLLLRANHLVLATSLVVCVTAAAICAIFCSPALRVALPVAMAMIPINNLVLVRQGAMQALRHVVRGQIPEYLIRPTLILVLALAAHLFVPQLFTPVCVVLIAVVATSVAFVVGTVWLIRVLPEHLRGGVASYTTGAWLRAAVPMMLVASVVMINTQVSVLLVGLLAGHKQAGVFSIAENGGTVTGLVLYACLVPLAPELARLSARAEHLQMERIARRVAQLATCGSIPLACGFAIFPGFVLGIFGSGFKSGETAMIILALSQIVNAAAGPAGNVLLMTGNERWATLGVGCGLIANVVLTIVLVPILGITGAAIGEAASTVIWNVLMLCLVRARVGINAAAVGPRLQAQSR